MKAVLTHALAVAAAAVAGSALAYDIHTKALTPIREKAAPTGAALRLALEFIRTFPRGKAEYCWRSYEPENEVAKKLYASFGFVENGEMDGDEIVAVLKL